MRTPEMPTSRPSGWRPGTHPFVVSTDVLQDAPPIPPGEEPEPPNPPGEEPAAKKKRTYASRDAELRTWVVQYAHLRVQQGWTKTMIATHLRGAFPSIFAPWLQKRLLKDWLRAPVPSPHSELDLLLPHFKAPLRGSKMGF